jgi:hypothetical protein
MTEKFSKKEYAFLFSPSPFSLKRGDRSTSERVRELESERE